MREALIAVLVAGCKFNEPHVGGDAGDDGPMHDGDGGLCAAVEIAAGGDHTCARLTDGSLSCWGANTQGQIGVPASSSCGGVPCNTVPVQVPLSTVMSLGLGGQHTCAMTASGVYCWGANDAGEFGNGTAGDSATPVLIPQRTGTTALVGGDTHTCSLVGAGVLCSGLNDVGQIGDGTNVMKTTPTPALLSLITIVKIGSGQNHVFGIADNGNLYGWGKNNTIQLDNIAGDKLTPIQLTATNVTQVAGGDLHTCALIFDHSLRCRGSNAFGQIGQGSGGTFGFVPVTAISTNIDMVSAGGNQTCALTGGMVRCFGAGFSASPVLITLPMQAKSIASGVKHSCAILEDNSVWCWGDNTHGQLGNGTTTSSQIAGVHALCR